MTSLRYFAEVNGQPVRFDRVDYRGSAGRFGWHAETGSWVKVERSVEYKSAPSKHVCDDRCMNATGRTMKCECSCGGKNHGRGSFNCQAA
jgi:hypothetical protein